MSRWRAGKWISEKNITVEKWKQQQAGECSQRRSHNHNDWCISNVNWYTWPSGKRNRCSPHHHHLTLFPRRPAAYTCARESRVVRRLLTKTPCSSNLINFPLLPHYHIFAPCSQVCLEAAFFAASWHSADQPQLSSTLKCLIYRLGPFFIQILKQITELRMGKFLRLKTSICCSAGRTAKRRANKISSAHTFAHQF